MPDGDSDRWVVELGQLRRELAELREEQRELARAVSELTKTFRALALHLGIASEPYAKARSTDKDRDLPGFA